MSEQELGKEELVDVVEVVDVARALIQLLLALVEPPVAQRVLNEEVVKAVNAAADAAEIIKFSGKN